ncbi:hypothetical protein LJ725_16440 [Reyranella aquatilis]|uniref:Secreted protein n=1 Tax=Reyranella aquatilis TaxID=2035356 RepID=A0ABS8KWY2_9HYPH|nr:hypothetical protein [Reyranella aquatilis]
MKRVMAGAVACVAALGGIGGSSAIADDRELQAILVKQGCVAGSIRQTELSPLVSAYDVSCRGSGRILTIVCVDGDCRLQPALRQDREGPGTAGSVDG